MIVQTIATRQPYEDDLSIIAVFDKFHTYEFILALSQSGVAFNITISRVFYKYGNYEAISAANGDYLAIKYKSKLLSREERYGFFDLSAPVSLRSPTKEYYTFAGYSIPSGGEGDVEIPWDILGYKVIHFLGDSMEVLNISNILRGEIGRMSPDGQTDPQDTLYTQKIQITANNIASARSTVLILKAVDKFVFEGWQIALLAIGSIVLIVAAALGLRQLIRVYRKHRKMVPLMRESQL